jgi:hypothetical protein
MTHHHAHQSEHGDVRVRQQLGRELPEEEGVPRHPGHLVGADDEEEVGDEEAPSREVSALQGKSPLEEFEHGKRLRGSH